MIPGRITAQDLLDLRIDPNKPIEIAIVAKKLKYGYKVQGIPGYSRTVISNNKNLSRARNLEWLNQINRLYNPHRSMPIVGE